MKSSLNIYLSPSCLALVAFLSAGCSLPVIPLPANMDAGGPVNPDALDPKAIFESVAKPALLQNCQGCHEKPLPAFNLMPFLTTGAEYTSITGYKTGAFITKNPDNSLLLQKGSHEGPALSTPQYDAVHAWLSVEAATRTGLNMNSPATPSVMLGAGNFFISLEKLTGDPLSKVNFTLELRDNGSTAFLRDITIATGPVTGLHVQHPLILLFSIKGANPDPGDSLSGFEMTIPASSSADMGSVLLPAIPLHARLALAFQAIDKVNPDPTKVPKCKDLTDFTSGVVKQMGVCAGRCHGMGAMDPQAPVAMNAFDMSPVISMDMNKLPAFCLETLARSNTMDPPHSVVILQATPAAQGGTTNHPFKLTDATQLKTFTDTLTGWITKEK